MLQIHLIIGMLVMLAAILVPLIYFKKKKSIPLLVVLWGGVGFYVFSQILENLLHRLVLQPQNDGSIALVKDNPLLYVLYGALAAAVFEEVGRFVILRFLDKKKPLDFRDGLAYGLGHGGLELFFIGFAGFLNLLALTQLVTQGDAKTLSLLPQASIDYVRNLTAASVYLVTFERLLAFVIQILLTFWVWKAVKEKAPKYFLAALGLHFVIDLAPALAQVGWLQPLLVEILLVAEAAALVYLTKNILADYLKEGKSHGAQSNP